MELFSYVCTRNIVTCVDHHHGQASRTFSPATPPFAARRCAKKADYYIRNMSWLHESMLHEPRGHRNMLGAVLTDPVSDDAAYGVIFLHPSGMFDGCGDSTFATAAALIELGMVPATERQHGFSLDTVLGPLEIETDVKDGIVREGSFPQRAILPCRRLRGRAALDGRTIGIETAFAAVLFKFSSTPIGRHELSRRPSGRSSRTAQGAWEADRRNHRSRPRHRAGACGPVHCAAQEAGLAVTIWPQTSIGLAGWAARRPALAAAPIWRSASPRRDHDLTSLSTNRVGHTLHRQWPSHRLKLPKRSCLVPSPEHRHQLHDAKKPAL
ncbi:hypothetical protein HK436_22690 [Mesorhizobium sediminum]|nr:hypothetical protein [Mesorhizobium sediminum]